MKEQINEFNTLATEELMTGRLFVSSNWKMVKLNGDSQSSSWLSQRELSQREFFKRQMDFLGFR